MIVDVVAWGGLEAPGHLAPERIESHGVDRRRDLEREPTARLDAQGRPLPGAARMPRGGAGGENRDLLEPPELVEEVREARVHRTGVVERGLEGDRVGLRGLATASQPTQELRAVGMGPRGLAPSAGSGHIESEEGSLQAGAWIGGPLARLGSPIGRSRPGPEGPLGLREGVVRVRGRVRGRPVAQCAAVARAPAGRAAFALRANSR